MFSQVSLSPFTVTAASDWPHLFHPRCFCLAYTNMIVFFNLTPSYFTAELLATYVRDVPAPYTIINTN